MYHDLCILTSPTITLLNRSMTTLLNTTPHQHQFPMFLLQSYDNIPNPFFHITSLVSRAREVNLWLWRILNYFSSFSSLYFLASLKKLQIIRIMIIPIGNALMMLTLWMLFILLSENTRAMGRTISSKHQSNVIIVWGFSFSSSLL